MKVNNIRIGDGEGINLHAGVFRQLNLSFKSSAQLGFHNGKTVIRPEPRQGWAEAARQMHQEGDDNLLMGDLPTEFENEEWT